MRERRMKVAQTIATHCATCHLQPIVQPIARVPSGTRCADICDSCATHCATHCAQSYAHIRADVCNPSHGAQTLMCTAYLNSYAVSYAFIRRVPTVHLCIWPSASDALPGARRAASVHSDGPERRSHAADQGQTPPHWVCYQLFLPVVLSPSRAAIWPITRNPGASVASSFRW